MNRRSVLGLLGSVPVVGPSLAKKLAHDESVGKLARMETTGFMSSGPLPSTTHYGLENLNQRKLALQIPWFRRELEQLVTERNRNVYGLDPDLAVLKSVSFSAKVYYQRQRNIKRDIIALTESEPYYRIENLFSRVKNLLG